MHKKVQFKLFFIIHFHLITVYSFLFIYFKENELLQLHFFPNVLEFISKIEIYCNFEIMHKKVNNFM